MLVPLFFSFFFYFSKVTRAALNALPFDFISELDIPGEKSEDGSLWQMKGESHYPDHFPPAEQRRVAESFLRTGKEILGSIFSAPNSEEEEREEGKAE